LLLWFGSAPGLFLPFVFEQAEHREKVGQSFERHHHQDEDESRACNREIERPEVVPEISHSKLCLVPTLTVSHFEDVFGRNDRGEDIRVAEAPGRVNLIGEHTDYNGLPVFPMALQRRFRMLFRPRADETLRLATMDGYPGRSFEIAGEIEPYEQGDWGNYVKASARILARRYGRLRGMDILMHSDIPIAAGLSSSSALVVGSGIALLAANGIAARFEELVELFPEGERYVGTRGGAMDHTVCLAGQPGHALKIDFSPFAVHPTPVPADWRFLIGHSLVRAEKSREVKEQYNERRESCRKAFQQPQPALSPIEMRRYRHVIGEAERVERARDAMCAGDLVTFGQLMNQSHVSLRDDFEVSHPEVDALVDAFLAAGALGARVTGAGFGGCVVALCPRENTPRVLRAVEAGFYASRPGRTNFPEYLLEAEPSAGANIQNLAKSY
jgi:galactokinase